MKHLASDLPASFRQLSSGDNFNMNIYEWLHIANMIEACQSTNKVNYLRQMLK